MSRKTSVTLLCKEQLTHLALLIKPKGQKISYIVNANHTPPNTLLNVSLDIILQNVTSLLKLYRFDSFF